MILTEKIRQILIDQGASNDCPREFWTKSELERDYWDQGIGFEGGHLLCNGYTEAGYVLWISEHRHIACASCIIRGVITPLTSDEYLKKM